MGSMPGKRPTATRKLRPTKVNNTGELSLKSPSQTDQFVAHLRRVLWREVSECHDIHAALYDAFHRGLGFGSERRHFIRTRCGKPYRQCGQDRPRCNSLGDSFDIADACALRREAQDRG
jgi:hypothetical protein